MTYCRVCVLPNTRPNLVLDAQGVCNACRSHATKKTIDWEAREQAFQQVVANAKSYHRSYDCVIPVSGGKDSTWQLVNCLRWGLHPLAVTWRTPARTELGWENLRNLIGLGVDHIDFSVNPKVEKRFIWKAFERFGTPMIPMHMALFNIPLRLAVSMNIPLVIWGENSAFEYGGTEEETKGAELDEAWLKKFGVTQGTTAKDWVSSELTREELTPYCGPSEEDLRAKGIRALFLGYYFQWDPAKTFVVAREHGFQPRPEGPKTGYYSFADIDDDFISIHHFLKWHKFGFTRLYDNLSIEIRNHRMTREEAITKIQEAGDPTPRDDIGSFCKYVDITEVRFSEVAETFRNRDIWRKKGKNWELLEPLR